MSLSQVFTKEHDRRIQDDVARHIAWQPEIKSQDISVKVNEGNVTLTGFVHTYIEKAAAERGAKSVVGVLSVANDIEVQPKSQRSDPEIARDVVEALRLHSTVPEEKLKVTVNDGFVTLEGRVAWDFQRKSADRITADVQGVRGVINFITIVPTVSTEQIKEKIEDAWKRTIDLDARRMSVVASDGVVSLFGSVHSWNERDQAEAAAWQAPGVRSVSNYLIVTP
jgi:osmotically-inducible protein OsmY